MTSTIVTSNANKLLAVTPKTVSITGQTAISQLNGVSLNNTTKFVGDAFLNSTNQTITIPSESGTLALLSDLNGSSDTLQQEINYLATRLQATLQYLGSWVSAGNLEMSDIQTKVDAAVSAAMTSSGSP